MSMKFKSLRPFIGAKDFKLSRGFYSSMGFDEKVINAGLSLFENNCCSFYLQDYYEKTWLENSMILIEVEDITQTLNYLKQAINSTIYQTVNISDIVRQTYGDVVYVHDPAGVLLHFTVFNKS